MIPRTDTSARKADRDAGSVCIMIRPQLEALARLCYFAQGNDQPDDDTLSVVHRSLLVLAEMVAAVDPTDESVSQEAAE